MHFIYKFHVWRGLVCVCIGSGSIIVTNYGVTGFIGAIIPDGVSCYDRIRS